MLVLIEAGGGEEHNEVDGAHGGEEEVVVGDLCVNPEVDFPF